MNEDKDIVQMTISDREAQLLMLNGDKYIAPTESIDRLSRGFYNEVRFHKKQIAEED